jgi:TonB family protein
VAADVQKPVEGALSPASSPSDPAASTSALHEVIPDVPPGTRQSIRGHIKVRVRIVVDPDGSVIAATADRIPRGKYYARLAVEAARQWTFPAIDTQSRRVMQIRFDFARDETTGQVVTLP